MKPADKVHIIYVRQKRGGRREKEKKGKKETREKPKTGNF
jgi:hypothetical protein